jgi:FAD/FMN-containing dehydrogenase
MQKISNLYAFDADHVNSLKVVTADGRIREVDAEHEPDLFWALRGGKGNLGIVTAMEFGLVPVSSIYGGGIYYPAPATADVLHEYRTWSQALPEEATASMALLRLPDMPYVPELLRGQFVVHLRFVYLGDEADGKRLLAPMRSVAPALYDTVETMPYSQVDTIHMEPLDPVPAWDRGILLRRLTAGTVEAILATAGPQLDVPLIAVELRLMGGQLTRQPSRPNAVAGRHAAYALHIVAPDVAGLTPVVRSAAGAVFDAVAEDRAEGALVNFLGDATGSDQVQAAYSIQSREWLLRLKQHYDPANLFAFGHALLSR